VVSSSIESSRRGTCCGGADGTASSSQTGHPDRDDHDLPR
jgi:hypothetical protein